MIAVLLCAAVLSTSVDAAAPPVDFGAHESSGADRAAIERVLAAYTDAVRRGDEAAFKALLLNDHLSFSGVGGVLHSDGAHPFDPHQFKSFDQQIFQSGVKYQQSFYNVHILQDGPLAQASLDFVTQEAANRRGGWGWKVLQLVKVDGRWKIASEFFTGHPLPSSGAAAGHG